MMGCSNPHPHCQVWTMSVIPSIPSLEMVSLSKYATASAAGNSCLLCDYVKLERSDETRRIRVILETEHWVALVPWWATWPFEIMVLPYRRHIPSISDLDPGEEVSLAKILSAVTIKYDNLFKTSFSYSMGLHQQPLPPNRAILDDHGICHLHFHFYPPLLRNSAIRKFLVGFEMLADVQRDLTPEAAADRLRQCEDTHYLTHDSKSGGGSS